MPDQAQFTPPPPNSPPPGPPPVVALSSSGDSSTPRRPTVGVSAPPNGSTPTPPPPAEHLETPGLFRHAQLAFLPEQHAAAAFQLGQFVLDLLFDSEDVRHDAVHDAVERVGGVVDDLDAAACALDEAATYTELEPVRGDLRRWSGALHRVKAEMVDTMVQHYPDETRRREAEAALQAWQSSGMLGLRVGGD